MYVRRFLVIPALFLLLWQPTLAATLYIDPPTKTLGRGDAEIFKVRLDTDEASGECINAVSGVVQFSGPLDPIDVSTGASILSIWLEPPTVDAATGRVMFAGGIPNGYCGRIDGDPNLTNTLFEIIARADTAPGETEIATLSFTAETTAYLNDGFGTLANLDLLTSTLTIAPTANEFVADPWTQQINDDQIPPQEFSIALERNDRAFSDRYYISFNTTDKQTGIDRYEVMEEPVSQAGSFNWGRADAPWLPAVSPYILTDQSLNSIIRVKATDKAGNEYIATIIPDEDLRTLSRDQIMSYVLYGFTLLVLLMLGFVVFAYTRRLRHDRVLSDFDAMQQSAASAEDETECTDDTADELSPTQYERHH